MRCVLTTDDAALFDWLVDNVFGPDGALGMLGIECGGPCILCGAPGWPIGTIVSMCLRTFCVFSTAKDFDVLCACARSVWECRSLTVVFFFFCERKNTVLYSIEHKNKARTQWHSSNLTFFQPRMDFFLLLWSRQLNAQISIKFHLNAKLSNLFYFNFNLCLKPMWIYSANKKKPSLYGTREQMLFACLLARLFWHTIHTTE